MLKTIIVAGGCFWGTEKFLQYIHGVESTEVGYVNGGGKPHPTYKEVCNGSGHAEAVRVSYDPKKISLEYLLTVFYESIDPTLKNRQGNDVGIQYRTGIYYENNEDKAIITKSLNALQDKYKRPVAVENLPLEEFYPAEEYHQKYLDKNPVGYCHIGAHEFEIARNAKDPSLN